MDNALQITANYRRRSLWPVRGVQFALGGTVYGLLEVLWRGYTHPSMWLAGGLCFCGFGYLGQRFKTAPLLYRCVAGALLVTGVEFTFGLVCNRLLGLGVWDYSHLRFHLLGQVCLLFTVLWGFLSIPGMFLARQTALYLQRPI